MVIRDTIQLTKLHVTIIELNTVLLAKKKKKAEVNNVTNGINKVEYLSYVLSTSS